MEAPEAKVSAETLKDQANEFFKDKKYEEAIELYTRAIEINAEEPSYYGNRSFAYLKEELYGAALTDASKAIELDKNYIKGYYRRATANMALGKFKLALKDYESVYKVRGKDPDAKAKFLECQKIVRRLAFERAIAVEEKHKKSIAESIDISTMEVEAGYSGPRLSDDGSLSVAFMEDLLEEFRKQGKLHKRYAFHEKKFTICGDVHGQFYDLLNIFKLNGLPSEDNPYLFNGDFVDRGSFSVETILALFGFKLLYPNHFFMSRGNHESEVMNQMYGFEGEVKSKGSLIKYVTLTGVMHGGLFNEDGVTLDDIRKTDRVRQPPESGIMCDLLWSDPQPLPGRCPSKRGVGCQFGPDITKDFCQRNGLTYIVRSHEVKPEGYQVDHDEQCITVFSAPNYCDTMGNKGALITINGSDLKPKFTSYEAVEHPKVRPMAYANSLFGFL